MALLTSQIALGGSLVNVRWMVTHHEAGDITHLKSSGKWAPYELACIYTTLICFSLSKFGWFERIKSAIMTLFLLQLKIRNDFDPVLSPESSLFVLKSNKQVSTLSSCLRLLSSDWHWHIQLHQFVIGSLSRYSENSGSIKALQLCSEFHWYIFYAFWNSY